MLDIILSYESLRIIWWVLLGVVLVGFAIMDGFDLGVATLLPFVAKTEKEKQITIHTIAPYWEGNQVWLLIGGGVIFASWPAVYAVAFSALYIPIFILLLTIILRPVSFVFREKIANKNWKKIWTTTHFISGFVPSFLAGLLVGNVILGVPFTINSNDLSITSNATLASLFSPYALLIGLISLVMLVIQGGIYTALKTENPISERAGRIAHKAIFMLLILYIIASVISIFCIEGYVVASVSAHDLPSNPLHKIVLRDKGALLNNFTTMYWPILAPIIVFIGVFFSHIFLKNKSFGKAFISNSITIFGIVSTAGLAMFPFILPSSSNLISSLTVWDSSASRLTLIVILISTLIFIPIIIFYTSWIFRLLRGKVTEFDVEDAHY